MYVVVKRIKNMRDALQNWKTEKSFCTTTTFKIVCYIYLEGIGSSLVGGILDYCPAPGLNIHADLHVGEETGLTREDDFLPFFSFYIDVDLGKFLMWYNR